METLLVEVYLPASGKSFELRLPKALNSLVAAHLAAEAISELSDGTYLPSRTSVFAQRETGTLLDMKKTLSECGIKNGSHLVLI